MDVSKVAFLGLLLLWLSGCAHTPETKAYRFIPSVGNRGKARLIVKTPRNKMVELLFNAQARLRKDKSTQSHVLVESPNVREGAFYRFQWEWVSLKDGSRRLLADDLVAEIRAPQLERVLVGVTQKKEEKTLFAFYRGRGGWEKKKLLTGDHLPNENQFMIPEYRTQVESIFYVENTTLHYALNWAGTKHAKYALAPR